jgi:hypothetical protein
MIALLDHLTVKRDAPFSVVKPMPVIDKARAEWVAELVIAYSKPMTSGARLGLLNEFFDRARAV